MRAHFYSDLGASSLTEAEILPFRQDFRGAVRAAERNRGVARVRRVEIPDPPRIRDR